MQSQTTQASTQNITLPTEEQQSGAQYGFQPHSSRSADPLLPRDGGVFLHEEDTASAPASGDAEVIQRLRQTNLNGNVEDRIRPSVQRIAEYENALLPQPPKKQDEGPGFKIVKKKKGHTLDGPQLDRFPNGMCPFLLSAVNATDLN